MQAPLHVLLVTVPLFGREMGGWSVVLGVVAVALMAILSTLGPLSGYIHPDEFFQSTEVVAGDVFNISHLRTWEFNPAMPLRDITIPYLLYAPGFCCLRWLLSSPPLSLHVAESYAVLVIPRLVLAIAGALQGILILKLCAVFAVSRGAAAWLWLSSYTTWTFFLRPFSNTSETLLFSVVWLLLLDLLPSVRAWAQSRQEHKQQAEQRLSPASPLTCRRFSRVAVCHFLLGVVLCMGFFNRPTFLFFVAVPLLWWLDQLLSSCPKRTVLSLLFSSAVGFVWTFAGMCVTNSLYYNLDFRPLLADVVAAWSEADAHAIFRSLRSVVADLRIPPWSFLQYNLAPVNLAEHGLHPWYTHLLVHLPSLLGPAVLLFYAHLARLVAGCQQRHGRDVLYAVVLLPVLCLSLFPHQEARFLLPVLPFVIVCLASCPAASSKSLRAVGLIFNVLGLAFFGVLHQGGVVPALSALQGQLKRESARPSNQNARYHVISYATYMLPRHLLFLRSSTVQLHVDDMVGAHNHPPTLQLRLEKMHAACVEESLPCHFWLLLPAPALADLTALQGWTVTEREEFCPHVSMERLPSSVALRSWEDVQGVISQLCLKVVSLTLS